MIKFKLKYIFGPYKYNNLIFSPYKKILAWIKTFFKLLILVLVISSINC